MMADAQAAADTRLQHCESVSNRRKGGEKLNAATRIPSSWAANVHSAAVCVTSVFAASDTLHRER